MRPIDADALKDFINRQLAMTARTAVVMNAKDFFENIVDNAPTIEPKKGKWITKKDACGIGYQICSNCETEIQWRDRHGVILRVDMQNAPYCPNCGAQMEEAGDDPEE